MTDPELLSAAIAEAEQRVRECEREYRYAKDMEVTARTSRQSWAQALKEARTQLAQARKGTQ